MESGPATDPAKNYPARLRALSTFDRSKSSTCLAPPADYPVCAPVHRVGLELRSVRRLLSGIILPWPPASTAGSPHSFSPACRRWRQAAILPRQLRPALPLSQMFSHKTQIT